MRIFLVLILILTIPTFCFPQQARIVSGTVTDSSGSPLRDVYISLHSGKDSTTTATNSEGIFTTIPIPYIEFDLTAQLIGLETYAKHFAFSAGKNSLNTGIIQLRYKANLLSEVVITSNPVTVKEDTVEYRASAYKVRDGAPAEEIIKKLPGVTVDKDGNVTAQGVVVKRIRVNGKDYFGGDVQTATQNLPADIIENIQIIDDYGDKANITGVKQGDPEKILNINIQKGKKKGSFGNATIAEGTSERYLASVSANHFKEDMQISLVGALNNTNANLFNFNGGGKGGGGRGANLGASERAGSTDGITYSKSLGINFRDSWGPHITSYGSYSFSSRNNSTAGTAFRQDFNPLNSSNTHSDSRVHSVGDNQRLTWNMEIKPDTINYIKISPYVSYADSKSNVDANYQTNKNHYFTSNKGTSASAVISPAWGSDIMYNYKFKKHGRNFNIASGIDHSSRSEDRTIMNDYLNVDSTYSIPLSSSKSQDQSIYSKSNNTSGNIHVSYDEPISKFTAINFNYSWSISDTRSIRDVDDVNMVTGEKTMNMLQSNNYRYTFTTNRYGLNIHGYKTKYNYLIGLVLQPTNLSGVDARRNINTVSKDLNIAPTARFVYNFAHSHSITLNYNGSSRQPGFAQLQPVSDSSNLKNIVTGNPNLKAEFTNRFTLQYNKVGILTGSSLFSNISFNETQNKIVSNRINDPAGTGINTTYLNTNGFYSIAGNMSYTQAFSNKKFSITLHSTASYNNNISFTDNQRYIGQNTLLIPGARFRMDIIDIIDVDLNVTYSINNASTKYPTYISSTQVNSLNYGVNGKNYFLKDWTLAYDVHKTINTGYINTINTNPTLLNLYVERRFLKKKAATLRFQAYDLFNQNTGISRVVNGTVITDYQNNRLGRYYLLSFNLRLQNFAGKRPSKQFNKNGEFKQRNVSSPDIMDNKNSIK